MIIKRLAIAFVVLALSGSIAGAQTIADPDPDLRGRINLGADIKLFKGFHLGIDEQLRLKNNMSSVDRLYTTVGLSYKFNDYVKVGAGYVSIMDWKPNKKDWEFKHRFFAEVTGSYRAGFWTFSLREKFLLTNIGDHNEYENPTNKMALKSRIQVKYRGFRVPIRPYVLFEARVALNDSRLSATYNQSEGGYTSFALLGYDDAHFNRYRSGIGADWKISKRSEFNLYYYFDYVTDKEIDVKGTELKSLVYTRDMNSILGLGYTFSF